MTKKTQDIQAILASSDHGFDDYDIMIDGRQARLCVPHGIRRGDNCNFYQDGAKYGFRWAGSLNRTVVQGLKQIGQ